MLLPGGESVPRPLVDRRTFVMNNEVEINPRNLWMRSYPTANPGNLQPMGMPMSMTQPDGFVDVGIAAIAGRPTNHRN